jgi:hypothetical protein
MKVPGFRLKLQSMDLSIDGPGSPVSLRKFLEIQPGNGNGQIRALLDRTGDGIVMDDPDTNYITTDACKKQAKWFLENFSRERVPAYAIRHILYMFDDSKGTSYKYKSKEEAIEAISNDPEHPDFKFVTNKFKHGDNNVEFLQVLGLLQLLSGTLTTARKLNQGVRVYLEHPDSFLHPGRSAKLMYMLKEVMKEFGGSNDTN